MIRRVLFALFTLLAVSNIVCFAEEVRKIQDNSFLIEEAYNQEPGVVQHIQTFQYDLVNETWNYTFTQEWPVPGQTHQFSYKIPVLRVIDPGHEIGIGDVSLDYRYQLIFREKEGIAFAPRFSLLLPTGDHRRGLGNGALGYQVNLPFSYEISDRWVTHWNAGAMYTPDARDPEGSNADILGFNYGASLIWLATDKFNFMLEAVGSTGEVVEGGGKKSREETFFISPGARFAIDFDSGLQVVPGIGVPIGIGPSNGEVGLLFYLSFEHALF